MNRTGKTITQLWQHQKKNGMIPSDKESLQLMELIRANRKTLEACECHDFSIKLDGNLMIDTRWECVNCGGEVDFREKMWYETGVEHARKMKESPLEV